MRASTRGCLWVVATIFLLSAVPAMAQPGSTPLTTEKAANNQEAGHLRELANAASRRAADWDALAKAARDAAAKATDPVIKKSWEDGARAHETRAKEQREEAARLTAQADEKAPPVKQSGAAPPSAPPPPPAGPPPIATGTAVAPAPGTPLGQPAASRCGPNSADAPLPIEGIAGKWRSDDGKEVVEIAPKTPGDNSKFVLRGQFEWEGSYDGSKLIFIRKPKANEMGDLAPGWALTKVAGVLQWSLELEARRKCGVARIEGQWFPGTVKFLEEKDAVGGIVRQEVSITGKGKPVAVKYTRDAPAIAGAFALEVQTGFTAAGNPKKPYPFQASVSPLFAEPLRTLFVYGFDLPKDKIRITSEDPAIEYSVIATSKHLFGSPANLADPQKALFVKGWNQVMSALDADTATLARDMDSVLVQARLRSGTVLPGIKHFAMNELDGSWRLRFGDDRATITLVREITPKMYDSTTSLILPERFAIEVRTDGDFPIDVIPLKLQLNVRPITWNGKPTLAARKMPRDPAVDLLRKDMKETPLPTVYRTDFIDLLEKGQQPGPPVVGRYYLRAAVGDNLFVTLEDQTRFVALPPDIMVPILRNPDVLGMTWKDALTRAARAKGIAIQDWKQLSGADATRISNLIVTNIVMKGALVAHVRVTVGDHAALLLFRDEFVKKMKAAIATLEEVKGDEALRGWRKSIGREIWDDGSPWQYLEIACPKGGECPFYKTFNPDFLEKEFGPNLKAAESWSLRAVHEGIGEYKKKAVEATAKAEAVADGDVEELIRLLGHGYDALLPSVVSRMMRLVDINAKDEVIDQDLREWVEQNKKSNPVLVRDLEAVRYLWVPELNARYTLRSLRTLAEEVQAQKDFSKADTAVTLAIVGLVSMPLLAGEGLITACLAWTTEALFLGQTLISEVPDFVYQRQDVQFALGAHLVLGGDRLSEALLKETKWYELFFAVAPAAFGTVFATYQTASAIRAARIMPRVKAGGGVAFKLLDAADQAAVIREMSEAKLLQEYGQGKALNSSQRSAEEAVDALIGEAKATPATTPKLTPEPAIDASGEVGPRPTPKPEPDLAVVPPKRTPKLSPLELPPKPVPGLSPREFQELMDLAPEAGKPWKTMYEGKVTTFQLGARIGEESANARVFRLVNSDIPGCKPGCLIKTLVPGDTQVLLDTVNGGKLVIEKLGDAILQPKLFAYDALAPRPYMIVEELVPVPGELELLNWDKARALTSADKAAGDALLEGGYQLANAGLGWSDMHPANYYLKKVNGKWRMGILDPDMIAPYDKMNPRVAKMASFKEFKCFEHCGSLANSRGRVRELTRLRENWAQSTYGTSADRLTEVQLREWDGSHELWGYIADHPGPHFPDAFTAMEKTMELNGFFWTDPNSGRRIGTLVDPGLPLDKAKWKPKFPEMFMGAPFDPIDPIDATTAKGFWNP